MRSPAGGFSLFHWLVVCCGKVRRNEAMCQQRHSRKRLLASQRGCKQSKFQILPLKSLCKCFMRKEVALMPVTELSYVWCICLNTALNQFSWVFVCWVKEGRPKCTFSTLPQQLQLLSLNKGIHLYCPRGLTLLLSSFTLPGEKVARFRISFWNNETVHVQ